EGRAVRFSVRPSPRLSEFRGRALGQSSALLFLMLHERERVPLEHVSELLGHKSVTTTERHYAKWVKGRGGWPILPLAQPNTGCPILRGFSRRVGGRLIPPWSLPNLPLPSVGLALIFAFGNDGALRPRACRTELTRYPSGSGFFHRLERHYPRNAFHDLFILWGLFEGVGRLQAHPYFRCTANQAGDFQAHDSGQGFAPCQNAVQHLAGHSERFGRGRYRQADRRQNVLLDDLAWMNWRQSVLSLHNSGASGNLQSQPPRRFRPTSRK